MNSDERIDRLSDRIDALTQSVGLLASLHRDLETDFAEFRQEMKAQNGRLVGIAEQLTAIVQNHEKRLNGLEGSAG